MFLIKKKKRKKIGLKFKILKIFKFKLNLKKKKKKLFKVTIFKFRTLLEQLNENTLERKEKCYYKTNKSTKILKR